VWWEAYSVAEQHRYSISTKWTGNLGQGTSGYRAYSRNHEISAKGKPNIEGSAAPAFRGDPARYNPEELLVSALSVCHMLWVLHLCAQVGIVIMDYTDEPVASMAENEDGSGQFEAVTLNPQMTITDGSRIAEAAELHSLAHEKCFIARSMNFPVYHVPTVTAEQTLSVGKQQE
jgi:organic hydroperoxide reductase OsmC/OhrA